MDFALDELDRIGSDITMEEIEEKMANGSKFVAKKWININIWVYYKNKILIYII